jgi:DNA-binding NtrC family response regulator/tetratricopeptide (TPR) repeat protein
LINEYLGELYMEMGDYDKAAIYLESSIKSCGHALAESDVSTEVRRRRAELNLNRGDYELSKSQALECLRLCKRVNDKYELGAALRVLGNVYAQYGDRKAVPCYESAISTLRNIHECYELMKTCLDYGRFLVNNDKADGEVYLLEARQLCKKLELEFFIAKVEVELSKLEMNRNRLSEAHERLAVAKVVCDRLQKCDKRQIAPLIDHARGKLNRRIFEESMTGAKEIRSICRLYEDARFPMNGMKPDIAYQVAQTVNAESLFLIKRCGRGYSVPVSYNISINEAKEIVRRLDRDNEKPVLGIDKNPRVFTLHSGCVLVCVPTTSGTGYVLCTCISGEPKISSRLFEFLLASAEAIERVADGDYESPDFMEDDFIIANGKDMLSHPRGEFKDIVTVTPNMIKLICLAKRASRSDETILIEGETGVGKELFAKAIHASSKRSTKPFVTINAGGLPVSLLESQLFGHIKGAFTDAVSDRTGLIEEAAHGIVFLDEVGEMGPELQVKLLRLLENGEYRRLGDNTLRFAKVRVISATNRDLLRDVDNGRFRRDLYYRLATVRLHIPPLRFRRRDIEVLIRQFLTDRARRNGQSDRYYGVDVKAMEALEFYNWPGNVRELQNEIRRIVSLIGENEIIRFGMISPHIREYLKSKNRSESLLGRSVERFERRLILEALNNNDWNRLRTAEELGIPRTTLLAKMRRLNVATRQSNQNVDAL